MTNLDAETRTTGIRPAATLGLTAAMAALAVALGFALPAARHPGTAVSFGLVIMIVIAVIAELASVDQRVGAHNHTLSLSEVGLVVGLAFAAPSTVVVGRVVGGLIVFGAVKRIPGPKLAFNVALFALETTVAAAVFHGVIAGSTVVEPRGWIALTLAVVGATLVGLTAVRMILAIHAAHAAPQPMGTAFFSLAITATGTAIGILAVIGLDTHVVAAVVVITLIAFVYGAMRTISSLLRRAV